MNNEINTLFHLYGKTLPPNLHLEEEVVEHLLERIKYLESTLSTISTMADMNFADNVYKNRQQEMKL